MAQVTITLADDDPMDLSLSINMTFDPPLKDDHISLSQATALRMASQIGSRQIKVNRHRLELKHHRRPMVPTDNQRPGASTGGTA